MNRFLTFLLFVFCLNIYAQVPQGVGYQGVATDANGIELVNQSISIRASVMSGSATGNIEWQETHNTSTDTFGLFNLTIGQGTTTGNGAQANFADISWGASTHFLKIEMDVNGGSNYSFMGTNQLYYRKKKLRNKNNKKANPQRKMRLHFNTTLELLTYLSSKSYKIDWLEITFKNGWAIKSLFFGVEFITNTVKERNQLFEKIIAISGQGPIDINSLKINKTYILRTNGEVRFKPLFS